MKRWVIALALVIWVGAACPGFLTAQVAATASPGALSGDDPVPAGTMGVPRDVAPRDVAPRDVAPAGRAAVEASGVQPAAAVGAAAAAPADVPSDETAQRAMTLQQEEAIRRQERLVRAEKHVQTGRELLKERKYAAALENFESALSLYPRVDATERAVAQTSELAAQSSYFLARQLVDQKSFAEAREKAQTSIKYMAGYRPAERLLRDIEREEKKFQEERLRGPRVDETAEFKAKQERIDDNYEKGKELFHFGEIDKARARFEAVLNDDPYHRDAKRYLTAIAERDYDSATVRRESITTDRIAEVREAWAPRIRRTTPTFEPDRTSTPQPGEGTELITRKLNEILIPQLEFVDANIQDVVNFLVTTSREIDRDGKGVNILLKLRPTSAAAAGFPEGFPGTGGFPGGPGGLEFPGAPPTGFPGGFPGGGEGQTGGFPGGGFPGGGFPGQPGAFPGAGDTGFPSPFPTGEGGFPGGPTGFPSDQFQVYTTTGMTPQITMNLRDIPLIDAIRYVTEIAGLKFRIESNAVIITPLSDIVTAMVTRIYPVQPTLFRTYFADATTDQQTQQDRTGSGGGEFIPMQSRRQMVNVAQYSQLVRLMFQEMGVVFPVGSSISYNERISTLIVKNTPENLELLERVLLVLNVIPHQVEIEARFVEISQDDLEELAIQWFLTDNYEIVSQRGAGPLSGRQRLQVNQDELTSGLRYATDVGQQFGTTESSTTGGAGGGFFPADTLLSLSTVLTNPEFTVLIRALDQQQNTDVLSAPKITTISGSQAQIQVVIELIYPTDYDVTEPTVNDSGTIVTPAVIQPTDFETREVGVILNVTPTVSSDGYTINLAMVPEVSELIDWIDYGYEYAGQQIPLNQPIFSSRNATTNLIIYDGQTVVLGGLITEAITKLRDKVPILGDIPIFGRLFRSELEASEKRNLLIFTTARLVDPAGRPIHPTEDVTDFVRGRPTVSLTGGLEPAVGRPLPIR